MSMANISLDDFDPPIVYTNPVDWSTPNPQDHPTWFNQSKDVTGSIWYQGAWGCLPSRQHSPNGPPHAAASHVS